MWFKKIKQGWLRYNIEVQPTTGQQFVEIIRTITLFEHGEDLAESVSHGIVVHQNAFGAVLTLELRNVWKTGFRSKKPKYLIRNEIPKELGRIWHKASRQSAWTDGQEMLPIFEVYGDEKTAKIKVENNPKKIQQTQPSDEVDRIPWWLLGQKGALAGMSRPSLRSPKKGRGKSSKINKLEKNQKNLAKS